MTKYAAIIPTGYLDDKRYTGLIRNASRSTHFILGQHLIQEQKYSGYYASLRDDYPNAIIIVDNGVAEGEKVDFISLVEHASKVRANYIVMPDELRNYPNTIEKTKKGLFYVAPRQRILVPQAQENDWGQWLQCVNELYDMVGGDEGFGMWGIPKLLERWTDGRNQAMAILQENGYLTKPVHFLGFSHHPVKEVQAVYEWRQHIYSWDSGAAFAYAQHSKSITYAERESLDWKRKPNEQVFQSNVHLLDTLMSPEVDLLGALK